MKFNWKQMLGLTVIMLFTIAQLSFAQKTTSPVAPETFKKLDAPCAVAPKAPMMMGIPDLSEDQIKKINDLKLKMQKDLIPLTTKLDIKKAELDALVTAEKVDMTAVNAKIDEIGLLKAQIQKVKLTHHNDVRSLLTEKQRVAFDMKYLNKDKGNRGGNGQCGGSGKCSGNSPCGSSGNCNHQGIQGGPNCGGSGHSNCGK